MATTTLLVYLAASLLLAPVLILGTRQLVAIFVREGADLFIDLDIHRAWAGELSTPIATINGILFTLAWWAAVLLAQFELSPFVVATPFLVVLMLGFLFTCWFIKARLHLQSWPACTVGLLTFAGGNLPVLILMPLLLMLVMAK